MENTIFNHLVAPLMKVEDMKQENQILELKYPQIEINILHKGHGITILI